MSSSIDPSHRPAPDAGPAREILRDHAGFENLPNTRAVFQLLACQGRQDFLSGQFLEVSGHQDTRPKGENQGKPSHTCSHILFPCAQAAKPRANASSQSHKGAAANDSPLFPP